MANALERLATEARDVSAFTDGYFSRLKSILDRIDRNAVARLAQELESARAEGATVFGMGASTKGNVTLQYCEIGTDLMPCIAEVNEDKYGCFTPGTEIPIVSEAEAVSRNPTHFLVLPWHFRKNLLPKIAPLMAKGVKVIFPLPEIEIVSSRQDS